MDTNNNTQQTNTFLKGMNTDISDMLIEDSEYRLAENLRYVTNTESNTGELRLIEGDVKCDLKCNDEELSESIIAATSIRDIIILITKRTDGKWSVYNGTLSGSTINCNRVFGPCTTSIGDGYKNKLSLVTRWEDSDNVKLYIADGQHPLMVVNVTKNNGTTIADITNIRNVFLSQLTVEDYTTGALKPALIQYAYRLYNKNGVSTDMSPVTPLYKIQEYRNQYTYGLKQDSNSTRGFKISGTINGDFEKIQLYRISYVSRESEPVIELIYQGKYEQTFKYEDRGGVALSTITLAEYNSIAGINIIPSIIESKNDYLFAANVNYESYTYDQSILNWDARCYSSGDYYKDTNGNNVYCIQNNIVQNIDVDVDILNDNLLNSTEQYDVEKWLSGNTGSVVIGGIGTNVSYSFITRDEVLDQPDAVNNREVDPYINHPEQQLISAGNDTTNRGCRYNSLWRDEIYRYGIVLYDQNNVQYPVKWMMDVRTPAQKDIYTATNVMIGNNDVGKISTYSNGTLTAKSLGIQFTITLLPESVKAYEIVRCNRSKDDARVINQGIISTTVEKNGVVCPTGAVTPFKITYDERRANNDYHVSSVDTYATSNINVLQYFSPDVSYSQNNTSDVLDKSNTTFNVIKNVCGVYDTDIRNDAVIDSYQQAGFDVYKHRIATDWHENAGAFTYVTLDAKGNGITTIPSSYYYLNSTTSEGNEVQVQLDRQHDGIPRHTYGKAYKDVFYNFHIPSYRITDFAQVKDVPDWNEFATSAVNPQLTFRDDVATVGRYTFYKWSVPFFLDSSPLDSRIIEAMSTDGYGNSEYTDGANKYKLPIGYTDPSLLLVLNDVNNTSNDNIIKQLYEDNRLFNDEKQTLISSVGNICKSVIPYGGYTNYARINSIYYSHGQYHEVDSTNNQSVVNVYDGDAFVKIYEFTPMHVWYNAKLKYVWHNCITYALPMETSIDIDTQYGSTFSKVYHNENNLSAASYVQNKPANVDDRFTQTVPMYVYNQAYSSDSYTKSFTGIEEEYLEDNKYDYRVHYSQLKTNNEQIDNWTIFKSADYLDVDTRYGQITDLRLFNNQLLYWQDNAFGILSVNERTLLQDINDTNIMLGTGDVLQRYDHISTEYGMKPNQYADVQSNTTLYWWDGYKKELLAYGGGNSGVLPLSKVKNVRNYINERDETSHPTLAYDYKYNEIMFNVVNDGSLTYNENIQAFTSVYPKTQFSDKVQLVNNLLLIDESDVYKWDETNGNTATSFGNAIHPMLKYVVNKASTEVKVFDNVRFGGRFYGGDFQDDENVNDLKKLKFKFDTPLKQHSELEGKDITNREYDFRFAIPRHNDSEYGGRMRGKTMQCELSSNSNSLDFSLQYITTKFRISWS